MILALSSALSALQARDLGRICAMSDKPGGFDHYADPFPGGWERRPMKIT
jgi:hypothetical protein